MATVYGPDRPRPQKKVQVLECNKCKCKWLYSVNVAQFSAQQIPIIQEPVAVMPKYPVLICARCGAVVKANVSTMGLRHDSKLYNEMMKEINEPLDISRKQTKDEE